MRRTLQSIAIGGLLSLALSACTSTPLPPEMNNSWSDRPSFVRSDSWTECVPYAQRISGIQIYGDAHSWWDQAAGRYVREPLPQSS